MLNNWWLEFIGVRTELEAIESPQERALIWLEVEKRVRCMHVVDLRLMYALANLVAFGIAVAVYRGLLDPVLGSWVSPNVGEGILGGLLLLVVLLIRDRFLRQEYARALRALLRERGLPVCMACGYNLTGIAERRCPECGAASSDATDDGPRV